MKEIKLTQGRVALVDNEDFESLNQFKWHAAYNPSTHSFIARRAVNRVTLYMTREILNPSSKFLIDHRDHNTLNNQRSNLRTCTDNENNRNRVPQSNCTSKYKGVHWDRHRNKWQVHIFLRDIFDQQFKRFLGRFTDEIEAAKAYDKIALEEFGEFAYLNFQL